MIGVRMICVVAVLLAGSQAIGADAATAGATVPGATMPATTQAVVAGSYLPAPPQQGAEWKAPVGKKIEELGKFVGATEVLFGQGMADPRGCEYREIEVHIGSVWSGDAGTATTHGWVIPAVGVQAPAGKASPGGYAVCWNGLVYAVEKVGDKADVKADMEAVVKADEAMRAAYAKDNGDGTFYRFRHAWPEDHAVSHKSLLPDKACLLLRLGEVELAGSVWNAWRAGMKENTNDDATHLKDPYLMLASDWVWAEFDRAVTAHMRADDGLALTSARNCVRAAAEVEKTAKARGFGGTNGGGPERPPLDFTAPAEQIITDSERRLSRPRVNPVNAAGIKDPKARAEALIAQLDEVAARQDGQPGGVSLGMDLIVEQLIACGEPAVEPLLNCFETDTRLTRSVHFWRDFSTHRSLLGVHEAAYVALEGILEQSFFGAASTGDDLSARGMEGRRKTAAAIRAYWEKVKGVPKEERWFKTLADDGASAGEWVQAASNIVQPSDVQVTPGSMFGGSWTTIPSRKPGEIPPLRGEPLRTRKNPSVADLLLKRAQQLAGGEERNADEAAPALMLALADWDGKGSLKELAAFTRKLEAAAGFGQENPGAEPKVGPFLKADDRKVYRLLELYNRRAALGDPAVLGEYAAFVRHVEPGSFGSDAKRLLKMMWRHPDDAAVAAAAERIFGDPGSPWRAAGAEGGTTFFATYETWTSPLLGVPAFQKQMLAMLDDTQERSEIKLTSSGYFNLSVTRGWSGGYAGIYVPEELHADVGATFKFRMCDLVACELARLEGFPRCEFYWPADRRNAAVAACKAFLKQYGAHWKYDATLSRDSWGDDRARLHFAKLNGPATRAQVAQGEAIFSLEGEAGEVKAVALSEYPLRARWAANKRYPYDEVSWGGEGQIKTRRYVQDGWVWQAEEITRDGKTLRYYGFSGRFELARVPAEELELPAAENSNWVELSGGLDMRLTPPGQDRGADTVTVTALNPGSPLRMRVELRNRKAVPQDVTAEWVRKDGGLKLRAGVTVHVAEYTGHAQFPEPYDLKQWHELKAKEVATLSGSDERKARGAGESWEAFTVDLHDLFTIRALFIRLWRDREKWGMFSSMTRRSLK